MAIQHSSGSSSSGLPPECWLAIALTTSYGSGSTFAHRIAPTRRRRATREHRGIACPQRSCMHGCMLHPGWDAWRETSRMCYRKCADFQYYEGNSTSGLSRESDESVVFICEKSTQFLGHRMNQFVEFARGTTLLKRTTLSVDFPTRSTVGFLLDLLGPSSISCGIKTQHGWNPGANSSKMKERSARFPAVAIEHQLVHIRRWDGPWRLTNLDRRYGLY